MAPLKFIKEPSVFGQITKKFSYSKMTMTNYLNILEELVIVE
jgi:predicted AAA+ superfamily ATPase